MKKTRNIYIRSNPRGFYFVTTDAAGRIVTESEPFTNARRCLAAAKEIAKTRELGLVVQCSAPGLQATDK